MLNLDTHILIFALEGSGLSEYLDQIVDGRPVGAGA